MTKFIKLTEIVENGTKEIEVYFNVSHIESVKISRRNTDTILMVNTGKYFFIKQKPDEIYSLIMT